MGTWTACDGTAHEMVYVAYATQGSRCPFDGNPNILNEEWYLTVLDVPSGVWAGPWQLNSDANFPNCVGAGNLVDNDVRPQIAVDKQSSKFWVTHTKSNGAYGTRVVTDYASIVCGGGPTPTTIGHTTDSVCVQGSPGCTPDTTGKNDGSGNPIKMDEWGPKIAFNRDATTQRVAVIFSTTRDDTANTNKMADMYYMYNETGGGSFGLPVKLSNVIGTGETIPWDQTLPGRDWSDYQGLAPQWVDGNQFLAAWGGDMRISTHAIYSALLHP